MTGLVNIQSSFSDYILDSKVSRPIPCRIVAMFAILVSGCAAGNYGKVTRSAEVDGIFRSGTLPSDYRYYYDGGKYHPRAVIGIQNDYTFQPGAWTPVDPDSRQLEIWRSYFKDSFGRIDYISRERLSFSGYTLLDPNGKAFGMIYSLYPWIISTFPGDNVVTVYPPEPYRKGASN
jgi:hypothetical protein